MASCNPDTTSVSIITSFGMLTFECMPRFFKNLYVRPTSRKYDLLQASVPYYFSPKFQVQPTFQQMCLDIFQNFWIRLSGVCLIRNHLLAILEKVRRKFFWEEVMKISYFAPLPSSDLYVAVWRFLRVQHLYCILWKLPGFISSSLKNGWYASPYSHPRWLQNSFRKDTAFMAK